ncbi:MAG: hypothetical protein FWC11_01415 [Firmicutes bacterium]|nr:hypothetical protein [Bacillota bacterium]
MDNNKDKRERTVQPLEIAWDMFRETGSIGYYMLYSRLKDQDNNIE